MICECGTEMKIHFLSDKGEAGPFEATCPKCNTQMYVPEVASARSRIGKLREIVREHSAKRIEGYLVDAFTAGMLVAVYDALSPSSREKFGIPSMPRLVDFGWKVVK